MAVWEAKKQAKSGNQISQVSWTDGVTQDVYYWLEHSFQYSSNINCDDEMHWIKLSQEADTVSWCSKSQLVSLWEHGVFAVPTTSWNIKQISVSRSSAWVSSISVRDTWIGTAASTKYNYVPWVVFQDNFWWWVNASAGILYRTSVTWYWTRNAMIPHDHADYTDESIMTIDNTQPTMSGNISAILNYNNTRLVVACWQEIWVYYPELERLYNQEHPSAQETTGKVWWKKVLEFEAWVYIVAMTCTFEYLKIWAVDEWWNTKVYYYQGNNNLRSTFVYNVVDLTGVRVTRVYSINGTDYYVSSQDGTDWYVNLYKMVGNTPVSLFHQRGGLDPLDVNFKAPYFVGPCGMDAWYIDWKFYIADAYWLFKFKYTPQGYDKWYMKRWLYSSSTQPYGVCFNQWMLFVSYDDACYVMREYDTWVDGYQSKWVMISREMEGREGGTITKMLDQIRLNYELNPDTNNTGTIEVYVSPNNLWKSTSSFTVSNGWYKVMSISSENKGTRTEKSELFNDLQSWNSAFRFDWQTITYAIVLKQNTSTHATPIVRQIDIRYHCKDKTNNVYDIN